MSDLTATNKQIQRLLGLKEDGVAGPVTQGHVLAFIQDYLAGGKVIPHIGPVDGTALQFDPRTEGILSHLDPKIVPKLRQFLCLAKATAATLACDYVLISGLRTWAEQDADYAKGRGAPGGVVTNARGGYSWHNFGVAVDAGVFQDGVYLDGGSVGQETLSDKVHRACSVHAATCGLSWGGSWVSIKDLPHFQDGTLPASPNDHFRELYQQKGSVL